MWRVLAVVLKYRAPWTGRNVKCMSRLWHRCTGREQQKQEMKVWTHRSEPYLFLFFFFKFKRESRNYTEVGIGWRFYTHPQVDLPHPLLSQFWQIGDSWHCDSSGLFLFFFGQNSRQVGGNQYVRKLQTISKYMRIFLQVPYEKNKSPITSHRPTAVCLCL